MGRRLDVSLRGILVAAFLIGTVGGDSFNAGTNQDNLRGGREAALIVGRSANNEHGQVILQEG